MVSLQALRQDARRVHGNGSYPDHAMKELGRKADWLRDEDLTREEFKRTHQSFVDQLDGTTSWLKARDSHNIADHLEQWGADVIATAGDQPQAESLGEDLFGDLF